MNSEVFIGTAGWSIPSAFKSDFPVEGSHLARYAKVFKGVEINCTFYKDPRPETFEKWAQAVPDGFEFSVKLSKRFSHECDLRPSEKDLREHLERIQLLGEKLGVVLLQFAPKMEFDEPKMARFYRLLRKSYLGHVVIEPRNSSWASRESLCLMDDFGISKVLADPERCPALNHFPLQYFRLHGSPVIYRSSYSQNYLLKLKHQLAAGAWCIFDNTTFGEATRNALELQR